MCQELKRRTNESRKCQLRRLERSVHGWTQSMLEPNPELSTFDTPLEESHSRSAECADPPRTCSHRGENDEEEIKPKWGS